MPNLFYYVFVLIASLVMSIIDYGPNTWQWWVITLCVIGSNIAGRETKKK